MNKNRARAIADAAWRELTSAAKIGPHGISYELNQALKDETRKGGGAGLPLHLAKIGLVESALEAMANPVKNIGDLQGIRWARVHTMCCAARLARSGLTRETFPSDEDLKAAGDFLFTEWIK